MACKCLFPVILGRFGDKMGKLTFKQNDSKRTPSYASYGALWLRSRNFKRARVMTTSTIPASYQVWHGMGSRGESNQSCQVELSRLNGFGAPDGRISSFVIDEVRPLQQSKYQRVTLARKWSPLKRLQKSDTEDVCLNGMNSRKQYTYPMTKQRDCSPADICNKCWKQSECR